MQVAGSWKVGGGAGPVTAAGGCVHQRDHRLTLGCCQGRPRRQEAVAVESIISPGQADGGGDEEGGGADAFGRSRACFEEVLATLADPAGARLTHAQMEDQLTALSRELMRTLHQDSLDLRAAREEHRGPITGSDQVTRGIVEQGHERTVATGPRDSRAGREGQSARRHFHAPGRARHGEAELQCEETPPHYASGHLRRAAARSAGRETVGHLSGRDSDRSFCPGSVRRHLPIRRAARAEGRHRCRRASPRSPRQAERVGSTRRSRRNGAWRSTRLARQGTARS